MTPLVEIPHYPVLITGLARSGTTALLYHLEKHYPGIPLFNEPNNQRETRDAFLKHLKTNKPYMAKIIWWHYKDFYDKGFIPENVFVIKCERLDIFKQIASSYISKERNRWDYKDPYELDSFQMKQPIKIKEKQIFDLAYHFIVGRAKMAKMKAHETVYYEEMGFLETTGDHLITPKPSNYDEIIDKIKTMLDTDPFLNQLWKKYNGS